MPSSGNSYKVRLLLNMLDVPFEHIAAEYGSGVTTSDEFRKLNPNGKVPLLQLEDGRLLSESNAILCYLAEGTPYMPDERYERAKCLEWMFFEQNYHEGTIAVRAAIRCYEHRASERVPEKLDELLESGHRVLGVMEQHLAKNDYFAAGRFTIADIALYAYTHTAGERGGFEMDNFPNVNQWLARCAAQPGNVSLTWLP